MRDAVSCEFCCCVRSTVRLRLLILRNFTQLSTARCNCISYEPSFRQDQCNQIFCHRDNLPMTNSRKSHCERSPLFLLKSIPNFFGVIREMNWIGLKANWREWALSLSLTHTHTEAQAHDDSQVQLHPKLTAKHSMFEYQKWSKVIFRFQQQ